MEEDEEDPVITRLLDVSTDDETDYFIACPFCQSVPYVHLGASNKYTTSITCDRPQTITSTSTRTC
jgi:hypothetical protein